MSDNSWDVHESFETAFQSDGMEELKFIDLPFLSHVDDILNELVVLQDNLSILSSSLILTVPESTELSHSHPISLDLSILYEILEHSPTSDHLHNRFDTHCFFTS
ncbi:hypothetical protein PoB_004965400 [Plakobranchus ocellatus]|uniref:Uncharacterized protein n=1 Tax=Plakobranchus ocellatus TaxID=259542 RepID=A0AAV4BSK9_9GAST|nr:hypothetical protein PoB_004965400 [Plakobranchus ocellatus]